MAALLMDAIRVLVSPAVVTVAAVVRVAFTMAAAAAAVATAPGIESRELLAHFQESDGRQLASHQRVSRVHCSVGREQTVAAFQARPTRV